MADALTFEKVWAALMENRELQKETDRMIKEMSRENDRRMQETREQMRETDRKFQETQEQMRETREQMKETDRRIGELGNRFGELAEHLVAPSIAEKFNALKFNFEQISQDIKIRDSTGICLAEIDILLENGDVVIAVEVKAKPQDKDVDKHIERMEVLRRRADMRKDTRKYRGAIAGAIMSDEVRGYAQKCGFYTIEQTGDTVKISTPKDFIPREW